MTQWFQLVLWDTSTAKKKMTLPHDGGTQAGAFSADGQAFATVGVQGDVELWDLTKETKTLVVPPVNSSSKPTAHGFSPDGQTLACAAPDSRNASYFTTPLALCDRWTGQQRLLIDTPAKIGLGDALAFSPDSKMLATGAFAVRLLDVATGKELAVYQPGDWNDALAFSRDGKILAVSYGRLQSQYRVLGPAIGWKWASWLFPREEQTVLLDVATGRRLSVLPRARKLAFLPDGKSLVTWWDEVEGPVLLWDVPPRMAFRPQLAWRSLLVATVTTGIWWSVRRRKRIRPAAARGNALLRQAVEQGTI